MTISGTPEAIIQCVKQICVVMLEVQANPDRFSTTSTKLLHANCC